MNNSNNNSNNEPKIDPNVWSQFLINHEVGIPPSSKTRKANHTNTRRNSASSANKTNTRRNSASLAKKTNTRRNSASSANKTNTRRNSTSLANKINTRRNSASLASNLKPPNFVFRQPGQQVFYPGGGLMTIPGSRSSWSPWG